MVLIMKAVTWFMVTHPLTGGVSEYDNAESADILITALVRETGIQVAYTTRENS